MKKAIRRMKANRGVFFKAYRKKYPDASDLEIREAWKIHRAETRQAVEALKP